MQPSSLLPLVLLATLPPTYAWGQLPHRTIALLSTRFLLPETAAFIRKVLPPGESISAAAIWGDYFSHTPEGRWSGPLHYIDAHDDPDEGKCGVVFERDCREEEMCVVGGIVNMTTQLQPPDLTPLPPPSPPSKKPHHPRRNRPHHLETPFDLEDSSSLEHQESNPPYWSTPAHLSLRLLLHLIGDIHQPLHTESLSRGGNGIHVLFSHHPTNLHSAWDSLIPQSLRHGRSPRDAVLWADELFANITSFPPQTLKSWGGHCFGDIETLVSSNNGKIPAHKAQDCAMEWARYVNSYVCSYVFKDGVESLRGQELSGEYTEGARELVDELVGMAGWRLGGWLNLVVTGRLGLDIGEGGEGERVVVNVEGKEHGREWRERLDWVLGSVGETAQVVFGRVRGGKLGLGGQARKR